jgi:4'-phosphopantetheinyl transferase EntD
VHPAPAAIRALLPAEIAVAAVCDTGAEPPPLLPAEQVHVRWAVAKRRREFALGRACARAALAHLDDRPPPAIPVGERRAPVWPDGVVGSITHSDGLCAAAVARASDFAAVGIDAEAVRELPASVRDLVIAADELHGLPSGTRWDVVAFSAKESVFKAWFPLTRSWLDFHDVALAIDARAGRFVASVAATVRHDDAPPRFTGRFAVVSELVLTAVCVRV